MSSRHHFYFSLLEKSTGCIQSSNEGTFFPKINIRTVTNLSGLLTRQELHRTKSNICIHKDKDIIDKIWPMQVSETPGKLE